MKTDQQLKQALAKMLPEKTGTYCCVEDCNRANEPVPWRYKNPDGTLGENIKDTELLHLCWLVEETLTTDEQKRDFMDLLSKDGMQLHEIIWAYAHATWQQRCIALAKVKGIEIPAPDSSKD